MSRIQTLNLTLHRARLVTKSPGGQASPSAFGAAVVSPLFFSPVWFTRMLQVSRVESGNVSVFQWCKFVSVSLQDSRLTRMEFITCYYSSDKALVSTRPSRH
jgi:hypothetical protein